jgi:hypothetical protein
MGRATKQAVFGAVSVMAVLGIALPASAVTTATVTPNSGLHDGQTVTVAGTGMSTFGGVFYECSARVGTNPTGFDAAEQCDLDTEGTPTPDASGRFSFAFAVHAHIAVGFSDLGITPVPVDCTVEPRVLPVGEEPSDVHRNVELGRRSASGLRGRNVARQGYGGDAPTGGSREADPFRTDFPSHIAPVSPLPILRERTAMSAPCPYCRRRGGDHFECREAVIRRGEELRARSVELLERAARVRLAFQTSRRPV